jgi:hypothetical protein
MCCNVIFYIEIFYTYKISVRYQRKLKENIKVTKATEIA